MAGSNPARLTNRKKDSMDFGQAIAALKEELRVTRNGWNGKGMWIVLIGAEVRGKGAEAIGSRTRREHIVIRTAQNEIVPWTCSQADMLAEDWVVVW